MYVTRIAPSPTGPTHIGTIRTAYFNWLAARASGGKFIVRIDDTDQSRSDQKYADQFLDTLDWLGLDYDDLQYQSKRLDVYNKVIQSLKDRGLAKDGSSGMVDLCLPKIPDLDSWHDSIAGDVPIKPDNVAGFDKMTIVSSQGMPTYHFASVVDDIDMGVNFIIRGVDHLTNTSKHALLYDVLGHPMPKMAHVGLITLGGVKLSKRDASSDIQNHRDTGVHPDAMLNFLARIGWGPKVDDKTTKILTKDRMLDLFLDGGTMKGHNANADFVKLRSFDRKYKARDDHGVFY